MTDSIELAWARMGGEWHIAVFREDTIEIRRYPEFSIVRGVLDRDELDDSTVTVEKTIEPPIKKNESSQSSMMGRLLEPFEFMFL